MRRFSYRTAIASLLVASLPAALTAADRVTVKGRVLEGSIVSLSAAGVAFEPSGTKGALAIKYEDIEAIETDAPYHVLHGEDEETVGRIVELRENAVLVGDSADTAEVIQVDEIVGVISQEKYESSWLARTRAAWRYWNANFDLGYSAEDATTDTQSFSLGLGVSRKKAPTRVFLDGSYRYDPLNLKLSVLDIYNNAPAPDTDRNSLTTIVGVSIVF
jgi:hypothetical protein